MLRNPLYTIDGNPLYTIDRNIQLKTLSKLWMAITVKNTFSSYNKAMTVTTIFNTRLKSVTERSIYCFSEALK